MLKKVRYLDTDVAIFVQEKTQRVRLLQHSKLNPLSYIRDEVGKIPAMIMNCSYFSELYVNGRNQGDLYKTVTHDDPGYIDVVLLKDNTYRFGNFKSWDYQTNPDVVAGFTVGAVLMKDGADCEDLSTTIKDISSRLTVRSQQTALVILKDKTKVGIVSEGRTEDDRGLTGRELRTFLKSQFDNIEFMCLLDGGGSSEMIVDGKIVTQFQTGKGERNMWNGLAFIEDETIKIEAEPLVCPFKKVKVSQYDGGSYSHKGSDAWDITTGVAGEKAPYFAPVDMVCKSVNKTYAFTWWETLKPVKFADGTVDYATIMFGHDDVINATVGMRIGKGVQVGNMGTGGNATGVHCHIEVAKGKYGKNWIPNDYNVYCLPNSVKFYDAFFMDGVELVDIKSDVKSKFVYTEPDDTSSDRIKELEAQLEESDKIVKTLNKEVEALGIANLMLEEQLAIANDKLSQIRNILG